MTSQCDREEGATLTEVLVTLAILALLSYLMIAVFGQFRVLDRTTSSLYRRYTAQILVDVVAQDLGGRLALPLLREDPKRTRWFDGKPDRMRFVAVVPIGWAQSALREVTFTLQRGETGTAALVRLTEPRREDENVTPEKLVLVDRVTRFSLSYYDDGGIQGDMDRPSARWVDDWSAVTRMPRAIRISIELDGGGGAERIVWD